MKESNHGGRLSIHLSQDVDPDKVETLDSIPVKKAIRPNANSKMAKRTRKPTRRM
jgi:hypothetical protein